MEMHALWSFTADVATLLPVGTGTAVAVLVYVGARYVAYRNDISMLDVLLFRRPRKRISFAADDDVPSGVVTPEALKYLKTPEEDLEHLRTAPERRRTNRRWGNPVEVRIFSPLAVDEPLRGVVINRSRGGVAILVDNKHEEGTVLNVRAVLAPQYVPGVDVEVKNCRRAGRNWVVGCKYPEEPPWNAIAWFG
jgi:hypothetical protein